MGNNNPKIKGSPIKPQGGRPANFSNPTNIVGSVKSGVSIKTTLPKGYVSGGDGFMGKQASGRNTVKTSQRA